MTTKQKQPLHFFRLRAVLATCTALAALSPQTSHAQLSIMGVLDTRAPFTGQQNLTSTVTPNKQRITAPKPRPTPHHSQYAAPPAHEKESLPIEGSSSSISANEIDFQKELGIITARGAVEIVYQDRILIADTVSYNQAKNLVTASGNVQLIETNGDVLFSEFIEITSDLKNGVARQLTLSLADKSMVRAKQGKRKDRFTVLEDAEYSPCRKCAKDPERPALWKLSAKEVLHDAEQKRIEYSDVFFEVFDVPILYTPYFSHPDPSSRRETGFLTPGFGSRGSIGSFISTPYFWNISPSKDLTLTPSWYYNNDQPHLIAEYRQMLNAGEMRLGGSATYIKKDAKGHSANHKGTETRWHLDSDGQFDINNTWRWGFNLNHASDDTYVRRYGLENKADNSQLVSDLYLEGFRKRNYMRTAITNYQEQRDIQTENIQNRMLEYQFSHTSQPQKSGAYWKLDGDANLITRESGSHTSRLSANTSWVVPYVSNTGDIITLDANLIAAGYSTYASNKNTASDIDQGGYGEISPSLSIEWRKPLSRTHMDGKANEIWEPIVKVKTSPHNGNSNDKHTNEDSQDFEFDDTNLFKTNRFSGIDKIEGGHRLDYGFNWGIFGNEGGYSQMFIGQSYRLREDKTYDTNSGHEDNLSDIVGRIKIAPSEFVDLLYRYRLDKNNLSLNRSETSLSIGPTSSRLSITHLLIESTGTDSNFPKREEIHANLKNQLTQNWYSELYSQYRMSNPEGNIGYGGQLGYKDECVNLYLDAKRSFSSDRDIEPEDVFTLRFELKNLGGFGVF